MKSSSTKIIFFKNIFIPIILILIISCIREIPMNQFKTAQKLSLSALLESGGDFRVKIGAATSITAVDTPWIDNAIVLLWENGILVDTLKSEGNGSYYSHLFISRGSIFTIEAQAEGFETLSATDTVPAEKIGIQNVAIKKDDYIDSYGDSHDKLFVEFKDGKGANFYELFFIRAYVTDTMVSISFNFSENYMDPVIKSEGSNEIYEPSVIFNDKLFEDSTYILSIASEMGIGTYNQFFNDLKTGNYIILRNVSNTYYQFRRSLATHLYNQQQKIDFEDYSSFLFDSNPEPLYSNVKNGYGIFAFYTQDAYKLQTNY